MTLFFRLNVITVLACITLHLEALKVLVVVERQIDFREVAIFIPQDILVKQVKK